MLQVLFWKKRGEEALQRSGVPYTIVRPGGLLNKPRQGQAPGNIVMAGPNTFGLPPKRAPGSILRSQVGWCTCMHDGAAMLVWTLKVLVHMLGTAPTWRQMSRRMR